MTAYSSVKRRYLLVSAVTCMLFLVAVAAMNALIDPYMLFDAPRLQGINAIKPRPEAWVAEIKRASALRLHPQAIILGNSRAEIGFDPEHPSLLRRKLVTYNLAVPGMGLGANIGMFLDIARRRPPQLLIVGMEFLDLLGSTDAAPATHAHDQLNHRTSADALLRLKALLTLQATRDSIKTLFIQHAAHPASLTPRGFNPLMDYEEIAASEGYGVMFRQRAEENAKTIARKAAKLPPYPLDPSESSRLRALLQEAAKWHAEVHIVIYPYHAQLSLMFDELGLWPAFEDFKRHLVTEVRAVQMAGARVFLWDFSGYTQYTAQPIPSERNRSAASPWYWEAGHFKKELGDIMLARMLDNELAPDDPRFGIRLNGIDLEAHLALQRNELVSLRKHRAKLEAEVRGLVRAAAGY